MKSEDMLIASYVLSRETSSMGVKTFSGTRTKKGV